MSDHLTEEEQIEAIKQWWGNNWQLVVFPVVFLAVAYFGWSFYKNNTLATQQAASDEYQSLIEKIGDSDVSVLDESMQVAVRTQAESIVSQYSDSVYADLANLILAKTFVEQKDWEQAQARLQQVVNSSANPAISEMVKIRLATVLVEQGKLDEALTVVANSADQAFKASFAEMRGDIYFLQGNFEAAKTAYESALTALSPSQQQLRSMLDLKLNGTQVKLVESDAGKQESQPTADSEAAGDA